jgi:hypothetical protein
MTGVLAYCLDLLLQTFSKTGLDFNGPFNFKVGQAK